MAQQRRGGCGPRSVAGVLAGMGDTLKDRLMGISSNIAAEDDEDDDLPGVKK